MLKSAFRLRFDELARQLEKLPMIPSENSSTRHVPAGLWQKWATSAESLIRAVFGEAAPHYARFVHAFEHCRGYDYEVDVLKGVFQSAREDFEGGYVFDVDVRISGEILGDFVSLAKHALNDGNKDVAAVLACAALEDALKRFATLEGLAVADKSMQEVVAALKSKSLVAGAQKSLLDAMPRIRDYAMHANWEKISAPDVSSVIGYVEQFLLTKFGEH